MNRCNIEPLSIIVAVDCCSGFGKNGKIPWNLPDDMKHFTEVTKNGVCIMGRKTYEDMLDMTRKRYNRQYRKAMVTYKANNKVGEKPKKRKLEDISDILLGRTSFVVTSNTKYKAIGATIVPNISEAVQSLQSTDNREVFVIGGRRLFIEALTWAHTVHMTIIKKEYSCDVFFPINTIRS